MSDNEKLPIHRSSYTRRDFLQKAGLAISGLGLLGLDCFPVWADEPGVCKPPVARSRGRFRPDTRLPIRTRKSASDLTPEEVNTLKAAYDKMRQLSLSNPDDPRGWLQQSLIHCWYCGGGMDGRAGEQIHGSWWFFPWHRCYLYFHERILGHLAGDTSLTLPYWDWDSAGSRTIPAPYTNPNDLSNPLFDANRGRTPAEKLSGHLIGTKAMERVMSAPTYKLFMGTRPDTHEGQRGSLERGPHGSVHIWAGTETDTGIDMGNLDTAAQDPLFYAHHTNIDRLWDVWLRAKSSHRNPTAQKWLTHPWTFFDENKRLTTITVADVLDQENSLRYRYAEPRVGAEAVSEEQTIKVRDNALVKTIDVLAALRAKIIAQPDVLPANPSQVYVLRIDGIVAPANRSAIIHVLGNLPETVTEVSTDDMHYLGYFTIIAMSSSGHTGNRPTNVALNVSANLRDLLKFTQKLKVTLVPTSITGERAISIDLSFRQISITEEAEEP
ncbi:MAG TPA: tyrosinase family protein [Pyrinomonadaceae bacterium]|nr:tyrosinase family protein [Pyrinomonadaceae bacterium]